MWEDGKTEESRYNRKNMTKSQRHIRSDNNLQHFFNIVVTGITTINETTATIGLAVLIQRTMDQDQRATNAAA